MPKPPGRACQEGGECVSKAFHKNKYSESVLGPIGKRRKIDSGYDLGLKQCHILSYQNNRR